MEQFEHRLLLSITPGQSYLSDGYLDVEDAWQVATGEGVVVAVLDDGIDATHPELADSYRGDLSWDFMTGSADAGPMLVTDNHGTAIAGIIAAAHNGSGTIAATDIADGAVYTTSGGFGGNPATIAPFVLPGLNNDFTIESPVDLGAVSGTHVEFEYVALAGDPATAVWDGVDTLSVTFEPGVTSVNRIVALINDAQDSGSPLAAAVYDDGTSPSGIAYDAELASYRLTSLDPDIPLDSEKIAAALGWGLEDVDVFSVNLGYSVELYQPGAEVVGAMRRGVTEGRDGLGSIYVFSAGDAGSNANYDALANSRFSIAVGSAYDSDDNGSLDSVLSAPGSAVLVSGVAGPNNILTTDRVGTAGYDLGDYTATEDEGFGGRQAAAAQVSGVIGLMLDANPALTYRDVQQILVQTSSLGSLGPGNYDESLGWGTVNAQGAVEAAANWTNYVAPEAVAESGVLTNFETVLDLDDWHNNRVESTADISSDIGNIEWVELTLYGLPDDWAGQEIKLTSPSGEESYLTREHTTSSDGSALARGWTFTSAAHWGEASGGEWTLSVMNDQSGQVGTWGGWRLRVYGQENAEGDTGPELVKIVPNEGGELVDGDVLDVAPRELILEFNAHQNLDATTLDAIQLVRSGGDGVFGNGNEETIVPGYLAKGEDNSQVIIRFAETLPDDLYRLTIRGNEDHSPLRNVEGVPFNGGADMTIRFTLDLGAQIVSVVPQPVYRGPLQVTPTALGVANDGDTFTVSDGFHEVTFEFNQDTDLLPGNVDDVADGHVPIRFDADGVTAATVATLMADAIAAQIASPKAGTEPLDGDLLDVQLSGSTTLELSGRWASIELGSGLAFGVQTMKELKQATDLVDVYFNDDDLDPAAATNPAFYRLYDSNGAVLNPVEVFYDPVGDKAQLRFAGALPPETYHLEVGASDDPAVTQTIAPADGLNSSFDAPGHEATDLGMLDSISLTIQGADITTASLAQLDVPGANDEPGHRQIPAETHLNAGPHSFQVVEYNFQDDYGWSTPNQIEENQKQRAREVFEVYSYYLGIEFRETDSSGLTVVTGDIRLLAPSGPTGPGGIAGISSGSLGGVVIMDASEDWGQSEYGGAWYQTAMHEIGHSLGLGHTYDLPAETVMGDWGTGEPVFPGNNDLVHALYLWPTENNEINLYKFEVQEEGWFSAETIAERLESGPSSLDTKLVLYREYDVLGEPVREVIACNDDYYSDDSFIGVDLEPGTYYIGVMASGMTDVDPTMEDSGYGGTSQGGYELKLDFVPTPDATVVDATGTMLDGDADGVAGGVYDFWFRVGDDTLFVDKETGSTAGSGTLTAPYSQIDMALSAAGADDVVRVVGNDADTPYLVGYSNIGAQLEDGALVQLPADVTMMIDAGAVFKLQRANIDIGSSAQGINRAGSALQVLGTPMEEVHFRSYRDDSIGGDSDGASTGRAGGDWGGLVFRADSDREEEGVFLNSVSFADIQHGGGEVTVDSIRRNYTAIHMIAARPTIAHNELRNNAGGAVSADLTSFEEDGGRIGPDIHGNTVLENTIDALFVRIETEFGRVVEKLEVPARWDDTDIVHVVTENLLIEGTPGGELNGVARLDARLRIDPAVIVKLEGSRIHAEIAGQLIAEGLPGYPVVFTSLRDDTYGAGGGFDTTNDGGSNPAYPGQWGGLIFAPTSKGSLDYTYLAYAGGETALGGDFGSFNPIEIHQADVRIANSRITRNAEGGSTDNRDGLGTTDEATIFVRGAQPIIVNNTFIDNNNIAFPNTEAIDDVGDIISIDVNSLTTRTVADPGRATGYANAFTELGDNLGPLVRLNKLDNNDVNSFAVRGGVLTTESVWDDTDIVHVVRDEIEILNKHTYGGLRLQSSPTESLVVKLAGDDTGFTADGTPLDIDDRIGGTLQILGQPNNPVVLTSLQDITIGAGFTPDGRSMKDTLNTGISLEPGDDLTPYVDVIVVIDESGSMGFVQQFTEQMIPQLDAALVAAGIGDGTLGTNRYGLVGFGGSSFVIPPDTQAHEDAHSHLLNGSLWGTATEYVTAAQTLVTSGAREDGWDGIQYALDTYDFRQNATKFVILATDEPRYEVNPNVSYNSVLTNLQDEGVILEGILGARIRDGNNQTALALDINDTAYLADGSGGFTTSADGYIWATSLSTQTDYVDMVFATGGLVGDISQIGQGGDTSDSFASAMISQILVQAGVGNPAGAGDWRSVAIEEYANTRNVAVATETEPVYTGGDGTNDVPFTAQVLGYLAPDSATDEDDDEKGGDENLRLGFEVHGHISMNSPEDVDVYSFTAEAGTEVWIDIDRTSYGLDAMVELIAADGTWLARSTSNGDFVGNTDPSILDPVVPTSLITDAWQGDDFYTSNSRDPAMHLVLPGNEGTSQNYFVRVSSEHGTSGQYQLQVRLRQVDESPGTTVRYADIRFATNGIEVKGMPGHSILAGEATETPTNNNAWSTTGTQDLGNLLTSDRNTLSVAGNLSAENDVDWYKFSLDYDLIQAIGGYSDGLKTWATVFDIDYADGLSRADTVLSVFDSDGNLILVSRDSDIDDDQPGAATGNDMDDLSRGSAGTLDPFIGSVQMPAGVIPIGSHREYYVAVSSNLQLPSVLQAPFEGNNANESAYVRLEPVTSVKRVAEDHINVQGHLTGRFGYGGKRVSPETELFDINSATSLSTHVIPYTLSDVVLFVSTNEGNNDRLRTVNPFTGQYVTNVGGLNGADGVNDIAMRSDGTLMAELGRNNNRNDGNTGELRIVDTGNASLSGGGNDGLPTDDDDATTPHYQDFDALAFRDTGNGSWEIFAVNNNPYDMDTDPADVNDGQPALWRLNEDGSVRDENGGATGNQPYGTLTGITGRVTGLEFRGSTLYAVDDDGNFYRRTGNVWTQIPLDAAIGAPNFSGLTLGPQNLDVLNSLDANNDGVPDEPADQTPAVADVFFASTRSGELYAFDAGGVPQIVFDSDGDGVADTHTLSIGRNITGLAFSTLDFNLWHPTTRRRDDTGHGMNEAFDVSRSNTTWLTNYAGGRSGNENEGGASFYFGMEPWVNNPDAGGSTSYFDYIPGGNAQLGILTEDAHRDISANSAIANNYNMPGGAYGKLITNSFSLDGTNYADKPTLYFNYFLETQGTNVGGNSADNMRDSARVLISADGGQSWELLATNNSTRSNNVEGWNELPWYGTASARPSLDDPPHVRQQVQELFDNTGLWRQARVDLGEYAGEAELQIRFEFSTAGQLPDFEDTDVYHREIFTEEHFGDLSDAQRGQDNSYEGFYIDDIIIGYAERGEMVTYPSSSPTGITSFYTVPQNPETGAPEELLVGDYQLEIRRGTEFGTPVSPILSNITIDNQFHTDTRMIGENYLLGDENLERQQDQLILEGNTIRDSVEFGISVDAGARDASLTHGASHPGGVLNTPVSNNDALVPGVVIVNNVIAKSGTGGIFFSGDGASPEASVPFGRIVNNTIAGDPTASTQYGIQVTENASPTILNNIITNAGTAISISGSPSTVVGYNLFKDNNNIGTTGSHPIDLDLLIAADPDLDDLPLFVNALGYNYYLASGALAIDSSLDVLGERSDFQAVKSSLDIPPSPIVAPELDRYGQLRRDDPAQSPPSGMGASIFKDRGAIERADFIGPTARLTDPEDNQLPRVETTPKADGQYDYDDTVNDVVVINHKTTDFAIQLLALEGIGIDDSSVNPATVITVYRTPNMRVFDNQETWPRPLKHDVDYIVRFDEINDVLHVIPTSGVWESGAYYVIRVNNSAAAGVRDQAGNPLQPTRSGGPFDGETVFTAHLTGLDFGDLPDAASDTTDYETLLDSGTQGGARHVVTAGMYLGSAPDVELEGQPDAMAAGDSHDDGVTVTSALLAGGVGELTVYASAAGSLNAWIDFNDNGSVADANERIATDYALQAGFNTISVPIPDGADVGMGAGELLVERFGRFRFSSMRFADVPWLYQNGSSDGGFEGLAYDGEVEDYQFDIVRHLQDWGDAPADPITSADLYPTLEAQGGASHYLAGPYLGSLVDAELNGQPTPDAAGDDLDVQGNDDDGIVFAGGQLIPGNHHSEIEVTLGGAAGAMLEGWIDFNGDGVWADEWATTGPIDPGGEHDAFVITANDPGQIGTGIRAQFHADSALSVSYNATDRLLDVRYVPGATTVAQVVDAINAAATPVHAEFVPTAANSGTGRIKAADLPSGTTYTTAGGDFAVPSTIGAVNPSGANNAFEILSADTDPSYNGFSVVFNHVSNPGDRATAVWTAASDTLTITFEPGVTTVAEIVAKINLAGSPLVAQLAEDPNLGEGVLEAGDPVVSDGAEFVLDGAYERIFTNLNLAQGTQVVEYIVPNDAVPGATFARFRVSSSGNGADGAMLGVGGLAADGEVEDYAVSIARLDYGDAPSSFGTLLDRDTSGNLLSDGARHVITGPWLGAAADHDLVGMPGFFADGDDLDADPDAGDDEDGVTFLVPGTIPQIVPGGPVSIEVTLDRDDFDGRAMLPVDPAVGLANDRFTVYATSYGDELNGVQVRFDWVSGLPNDAGGTFDPASITDGDEYFTNGGSAATAAVTGILDSAGGNNAFRLAATANGPQNNGIAVRFHHVASPGDPVSVVWNGAAAPVDPKTLIVTFEPGVTTLAELMAAINAAGSPLEAVAVLDTNAAPVATYDSGAAPPTLTIAYNDGATAAQIVDAVNRTAWFSAELDGNDGSDDVSIALAGYAAPLGGGMWPGLLDAWFDVNGNGIFEEGDERIFQAEPLYQVDDQINTLQFDVPADAAVGSQYVRFRVTSDGLDVDGNPLGPDKLALSGEVEDYMVVVQRFDYGDAPDEYGTLLDSNGARHVVRGPWLGQSIDHDQAGLPSPGADGDDSEGADPFVTTAGDDEDGVVMLTDFIPGEMAMVQVTVDASSPAGLVYGWFDFDGDGTFGGTHTDVLGTHEELAIDGQLVNPGESATFAFWVPLNVDPQTSYARVRIVDPSDGWVPLPTGEAPSGEVEDYQFAILPLDYGDAPAAMGTSYLSDGARHLIDMNGPYLGTSVDHESDALTGIAANGDDASGIDDEDGFSYGNVFIGEQAWYEVVAPNGGVVDVWVDFNGDLVFDHATEHLGSQAVAATTAPQRFYFQVPDTGFVGDVYLRARITSDGLDAAGNDLTPTGLALDGEVEDYWSFLNPVPQAVANGPYWINNDEDLVLNATGSAANHPAYGDPQSPLSPDDTIVEYQWDFDFDGTFEPEFVTANEIDTIPWPWYAIVGVPEPDDSLTIYLRVVDSYGAVSAPVSTQLFIFDNEVNAEFAVSKNADGSGGSGPFEPESPVYFDGSLSTHDREGFGKHIVSYEWDFDYQGSFEPDVTKDAYTWDGSQWVPGAADADKAEWTYSQYGSYTAVLRVTDSNDPAQTDTFSILVVVTAGNEAPLADAGGPYRVNIGSGVTLDGSASANTAQDTSRGDSIVAWEWDLNNDGVYGDLAGEQVSISWGQLLSFGIAAPAAGAGSVANPIGLRVTDSLGATATTDAEVIVHENLPHALANASSLFVAPEQDITFDASASWHDRSDNRAIVQYEWDFDYDGSFSADATSGTPTVTFAYDQFGVYDAMLRVSDDNTPAGTDVLAQPITVTVNQGDDLPVAVPGGPYVIEAGDDLVLDGSNSYDPDAAHGDAITAFRWILETDGAPLVFTGTDPSELSSFTLTWADVLSNLTLAESYELKLQVRDKEIPGAVTENWSAAATTSLVIYENQTTVDVAVAPEDMEVAPLEKVQFVATASNDNPIVDFSYRWDFDYNGVEFDPQGQYASVTTATPSFSFPEFGEYTVAVQVTDSNSPAQVTVDTITILVNQGDQLPTAEAGGPYWVDAGNAAVLDGSGSFDPDAAYGDAITAFRWTLSTDGDPLVFEETDVEQLSDYEIPWSGALSTLTTGTAYDLELEVRDKGIPGVVDADWSTASQTTLTVYNNVPVAVIQKTPDGTVGRTTPVTFDGRGSSNDRPDRSIVAYQWDMNGDGVFELTQTDPGAADFGVVADQVFPNFGQFTVGLRVVDNNVPAKISDPVTVTVVVSEDNNAPTAVLSVPSAIEEGQGITLDGSASSDPDTAGGDTIASYEWTVGGNLLTYGTPVVQLTWAELEAMNLALETPIAVTLTVADTLGEEDTNVATFGIYQNMPFAEFTAVPNPVACNTDVQFDASGSSHGWPTGTIEKYEWDFNYDGSNFDVDAEGVDPTHSYGQFGDYDVALRVTDGSAQSAMSVLTIDVSLGNRAPTADAGGDYFFDLDDNIMLDARASFDQDEVDGCGDSIVAYRWDLDGDGEFDDAQGSTPIFPAGSHGFPTNQQVTVAVQVQDTFGAIGTDSAVLLIASNQAPVAVPGGPYTATEGTAITLDGSGSTDDSGSLTYLWDLDNDGEFDDAVGATPSVTFENDDASQVIGLRVIDEGDLSHEATTTVTVLNADPVAGAVSIAPVVSIDGQVLIGENETVTASGTFTDVGSLDTHAVSIDWGDGTVTEATVNQAAGSYAGTHAYTTPGQFPVTVTVTDDDQGTDTAESVVNVTNSLGAVESLAVADQDPSGGDLWYMLTATRDAYLTVALEGGGGVSASTTLYDLNGNAMVPVANGPADGADYDVVADASYYLKLSGTAADVDLRFSNLVVQDGEAVTVHGTDGDDTFELELTDGYLVRINGTEYHFEDADGVAETFSFEGGEGEDTATFSGSEASETARFFPGAGEFFSGIEVFDEAGFFATAGAEHLVANSGGGGIDVSRMYDSAGDDVYTVGILTASMVGPGYSHAAEGFFFNLGYATNRAGTDDTGGNDQCLMVGSELKEKFKFDWDGDQSLGKMYSGLFYNRTKNFELTAADGLAGDDVARVIGSEVDDEFFLRKNEGTLSSHGYDVAFDGFEYVTAVAGGGYDIVRFDDTEGDDEIRSRVHRSTMYIDGEYELIARSFEEVYAEANYGGYDKAKFHDSEFNDILRVEERDGKTWAQLSIAGDPEDDMLYEALAFEFVRAYDGIGDDVVEKAEDYPWLMLDGDWIEEE